MAHHPPYEMISTIDIIPPNYTLQATIPSPSSILTSQDRTHIQTLLKAVDRERHHLERGIHRLKFQNYYLKRGQDVPVANEVLAPFDTRRWMVERMEVTELEILKNEVIRIFSGNRVLVREQHWRRDTSQALREGIEVRRRREEL
ncbi:MAG: hypothetical protein Q9225_006918 [Loekoesia sp. 1 TL-2023]